MPVAGGTARLLIYYHHFGVGFFLEFGGGCAEDETGKMRSAAAGGDDQIGMFALYKPQCYVHKFPSGRGGVVGDAALLRNVLDLFYSAFAVREVFFEDKRVELFGGFASEPALLGHLIHNMLGEFIV